MTDLITIGYAVSAAASAIGWGVNAGRALKEEKEGNKKKASTYVMACVLWSLPLTLSGGALIRQRHSMEKAATENNKDKIENIRQVTNTMTDSIPGLNFQKTR